MFNTLLAFIILLASPLSAGVSDAESIVRRPDGFYDVKCNDGSRELASKEQLDSGQICMSGASTTRFQIQCKGSLGHVFPVRASDGFKFGSYMSPEECARVAEASPFEVLCSQSGRDFWYVTRIKDGSHLGGHTTLNACLYASIFTRQGFACAPYGLGWFVTRVATKERWGTSSDLESCITSVRTSREGVVCLHDGGSRWSLHRSSDQARLGFYTDSNSCSFASDNAFRGKVCVPASGNLWHAIEITTEHLLSENLYLEDCITRL